MKKPDFFIVGAPKCGTSFLHHYLSIHPEIYMPEKKEIYFFGSDLHFLIPRISEKQYLEQFNGIESQKIAGEATATYLYSKEAAKEIKAFNSNAKIIILLRNPVDMIYSLHSELYFNGDENIKEFSYAIQLTEQRKQGLNIPSKMACPIECLYYLDMGMYYEQVKRYLTIFNEKNILIILYDDLKNFPEKTFQHTLSFLNVSDYLIPSFEVINANKKTKSRFIMHYINYLPERMKQLSRIIIPNKDWRKSIFESLSEMNTKYEQRKPMSSTIKRKLQTYFKEDVIQLSGLLNKDLTHWLL